MRYGDHKWVPLLGATPLADNAYLKRRRGKRRSGDRWYVRVPVPPDLQEILRKRTIECALNTNDKVEARKLKHSVIAKIFESFERARGHRITSTDIEHEAQRFLRERLEQIQKSPDDTFEMATDNFGNEMGLYGEMALAILHRDMEAEDWSGFAIQEADKIARSYGTALSQTQHQELCRALHLAETEALSRVLAIHGGAVPEPVGTLNAKAVDPLTAAIRPRNRLSLKQGKGIRVSEASEAYIASRNRERRGAWTGQTRGQVRTTFRLFKEFTRDASLDSIIRNDIASFLSALSRLDPNYGRHNSGKVLTLNELLKNHPAQDGGGISNRTLNRHIGVIVGMFDWAIKAGKLEGPNPAKGHHQSEAAHETDSEGARRSFTTEELKKLLNGPLFAISLAERMEPKLHTVETTLAWLIPIALYSGMRLDEICGLRSDDVMGDEGVPYFDLRSHEGRRLKTAAARRRIPVHSGLLRIGFGAYLAHTRKQGHEYLFPALKPGGPDGKRSWYVSKRFTTYRRSVGVGATGTVFHCFRKNAATALERARVPENEAVQVLGHKKMTMSYGLYSGGLDLAGLARVVEAITYPGLDLSRLHQLSKGRPRAKTRQGRAQ